MDAKQFWHVMVDVCQLGEFMAAIETSGAEINIVGSFQVAHDGIEMVLEKQDCQDHFHIIPEKIQALHFGYCDVSTGGKDPCIEMINVDGQVCLRLFYYPYQASELTPKHKQYMEQHQAYKDYLTGEW